MSKLLKWQKEKLVRKLITPVREEGDTVLNKRENQVAQDILRFFLKDKMTFFNSLPTHWVPTTTSIHWQYKGKSYNADLINSCQAPYALTCGGEIGHMDGEEVALASAEIRRIDKDREAHRDRVNALERRTWAVLNAFKTLKQLLEAWPEVYALLPDAPAEVVHLPARQLDQLSRDLGLEKKAEQEAVRG